MTKSALRRVVVIIDGPDPDNYVLMLAATGAFFGLEVVAVIMTGRPVCADLTRPAYGFNVEATCSVRRDNALHAKGILIRHGREHIPVFQGNRAPFSTVPHSMHLHERVTDVYDDAHAGHFLAGGLDDAIVYLAGLEGPLHFVCGGPLTDLAALMKEPLLMDKLGTVTAQLGMFAGHQGFFSDSGVTNMAGGRKNFNTLADFTAARYVLNDYPGPVYMIPTDITKHPDHGFDLPIDLSRVLRRSSAGREIAKMYRMAWPNMWKKRKERIFVHDFHSAALMAALLDGNTGIYDVSPVGIANVCHLKSEEPRWGEIDLGPVQDGAAPRYLTSGVDTSDHHRLLAESIAKPGRIPDLRARANA